MPCNSHYLDPDNFEILSKETAELICFVDKSLDIETPKWIKKAADYTYGNREKIDDLVRILCTKCKNISKNKELENKIIYNARDKKSRRLANWWEEHQKADEERIKKEKLEKRKKKIKMEVLSKLTEEEKEALGL